MSEIVAKQAPINSLSIIEEVNIAQIQGTMAKIMQFQKLVQNNLKQNHDFGVIPGTPKPTLLKPGAEKIQMLLGVTSEYELVEKVQDYDNGFFAFTVKCLLFRNGMKITEGVGHCNTKERKYIKQDPYSMANTCLKMAKKRAQVDASLTIGSLSDLFTQDLEDMDLEGISIQESTKKVYTDQSGTISQAQAKRMFALAKGNQDIVKQVLSEYRYSGSSEVEKTKYNEICDKIEILAQEADQQ